MKAIRIIVLAYFLIIAVSFISCSSQNETGIENGSKGIDKIEKTDEAAETITAKKPLTVEDIKKNYADEAVINITEYKGRYALVEYQREKYASRFDLYDLITGEKNQMLTNSNYVSLLNFENENEIYFLSNGKTDISNFVTFPYIIKCYRKVKDAEINADFEIEEQDYYAKITEQTDFGNKENTILYELKPTQNGFIAYFKPKPGVDTEGAFYAGYINIPATHAYLNAEDKTFNFEFKKTIFDEKYNNSKKIIFEKNQYINYLVMSDTGENCKISLNLKEQSKEYTVKIKLLEEQNHLPYAEVIFR